MKKSIKIIISMLIVAISISVCSSVKAATTTTTIGGDNEASVGNTVTMTVRVQGTEEGLIGAQGKIEYDKDVLEYESCSVVASGWKDLTFNENTGIYIAEIETIGDESAYVKSETAILEFKFKVKDTSEKNTTINISDIVYTDAEYQTIDSTEVSKTINITSGNSGNNNDKNNSGNENNNGSGNVVNNQQSGNINTGTSNKKLPYAGTTWSFAIIGVIIAIIGIVCYIKYSKYKGIKGE